MDETFEIRYRFTFGSGETRTFTLSLGHDTLTLRREAPSLLPPWTALGHHRCTNCPLDPATTSHCPIAANLVEIVSAFRDRLSHEEADVTVTTRERSYRKHTTIQEGLSSLKGIVMVTSGCPVMDRLKPMVRFHLPFATMEETAFRMVATYLVAQHYRRRRGLAADATLAGMKLIYADVAEINKSFALRLAETAGKDASLNALVNLDCFAEMIPLAADDMLAEIEGYFAAYLA
jgi:hypothetical protein